MKEEKVVAELLNDFERGRISRRQLVQSLALGMVAASVSAPVFAQRKGFKAVGVNHISFGVADYARTRDFYAELLGMTVSEDNGKQCYLTFGDTVLIPRNSREPGRKAVIDHIAYSIEDWDRKQVEEELKRRGLDPKPDYEGSFHVRDPDGYDLQISAKNFMTMSS